MADYKSKNLVIVEDKDLGKVPVGESSGDIQVAYDEYTSAAALVAADVIKTAIKLPKGRKVYQVIVQSPTNGGTVSVGVAGAATKYVSASTAAATVVHSPLSDALTADEDLILTIGGAPSAAGKYKVVVYHAKV